MRVADFAFTAAVLATVDAGDLYEVCGVSEVTQGDVDDVADVAALCDAIAHYRDDVVDDVFANTVTVISRKVRQ